MRDLLAKFITFRDSNFTFVIIILSILFVIILLKNFDRFIQFVTCSIGNLVFNTTNIQKREKEYRKIIEDEHCSERLIGFSKHQREYERFSFLYNIYRQDIMIPIFKQKESLGDKFALRDYRLAQNYLIVNDDLSLGVKNYKIVMTFNIIGFVSFFLGVLLMVPTSILVIKNPFLIMLTFYAFITLGTFLTAVIFGRPLVETFAAQRISKSLSSQYSDEEYDEYSDDEYDEYSDDEV